MLWVYNLEKITLGKLLLYIHFFQGRSLILSITTSFGVLRSWCAQDAQTLVKYANNRNVSINMRDGFSYPYTLRNAKTFLKTVSKQNPVTFYAIATSEEAVGGIGVSINTDVHRLTAELGYWLAEPYWGKGIMTEAVSTFTEYAFAHFGLIRIYAQPYANNFGSCRVLQKAGFLLEARMEKNVIKDGQILDQFLYAKVKEK